MSRFVKLVDVTSLSKAIFQMRFFGALGAFDGLNLYGHFVDFMVAKTTEPRKKKTALLSIESWLANRDPCNGSL